MRRLLALLKSPPWWLLALIYGLLPVAVTAAVLCAIFTPPAPWSLLGYFSYALAALLLAVAVYVTVYQLPHIKARLLRAVEESTFFSRYYRDYGARTLALSLISFVLNVGYALFNGALGIRAQSLFYGALAGYYLLLCALRGQMLFGHRRQGHEKAGNTLFGYRLCGVLLVVMPIALSFVILQMVREDGGYSYWGLTIYVAATYTFYKIVMAAVHFFKAKRRAEITVRALRYINLADAAVSLLALQSAMLSSFGDGMGAGALNAALGGAVCLFTLLLGVYILFDAKREKMMLQDEKYGRE